jgi:hypothetical protein
MQKIVHTQGVPMTELNRRFDLGLELDDVVGADMGFFPAGVVPAHIAIEGGASNEPGNPNTPPEGGDPGEPGDEQGPNEQPVQDIPDDPSVEDPAEAANREIADLEHGWKYFDNGHGDPHEGKKRWELAEAYQWIEDQGIPIVENSVDSDGDHFTFEVDVALDLRGRGINHGDGIFGGEGVLRFYHGEETEGRRERLLDIVRSWR